MSNYVRLGSKLSHPFHLFIVYNHASFTTNAFLYKFMNKAHERLPIHHDLVRLRAFENFVLSKVSKQSYWQVTWD